MAYTKKTNNVKETTVSKTEEPKVIETKTFEPEDLIPCRSMVSGGLYIEGNRSKLLYTWADYDDVIGVEYRDLIFMVRTANDKSIYEPRIIVEDDDFIAQNPRLAEFYESLYTDADLREIVNLPMNQMKEIVKSLPTGCKNALKGIVATMIDNGRLDSVTKIKALDEIFETNMLLTLVDR